jgi:hypothetical protein
MVTSGITGAQAVADIEVQSVAPAQGRQNQAQWMLTCKVPWSQYPERFWIDAVQGAPAITPGTHHCAFTVGKQKANTSGNAPFHYRFYMTAMDYAGSGYPNVMDLQFGGPTSTPIDSPDTTTQGSQARVGRDESIVRQSSIKAVMDAKVAAFTNATNLLTSGHLIADEPDEPVHDTVTYTANILFANIMADMDMWVEYLVRVVNKQLQDNWQEPEGTNAPEQDA